MRTRAEFLLILTILAVAVSSLAARQSVVTLDTLEQRRAPHNLDVEDITDIQLNAERNAIVSVEADSKASAATCVRALSKSYGLQFCVEYGEDSGSVRIPFQIRANQRLVDAMDAFRESSKGRVAWRLLDDRIVVSIGVNSDGLYYMERPVEARIGATAFGEAFAQIEAAYNQQYADMPLVVDTTCLNIDPAAAISPEGEVFSLEGAFTLREMILELVRHTQQDEYLYVSSIARDANNRPYVSVDLQRTDCRDSFESEDELAQFREKLQARTQRLDAYHAGKPQ